MNEEIENTPRTYPAPSFLDMNPVWPDDMSAEEIEMALQQRQTRFEKMLDDLMASLGSNPNIYGVPV